MERPQSTAPLHIVSGLDNNYVSGLMVLIASVVWHNPGARFTVLDMGISADNRARLERLGARLGVEIRRIETDEQAFAHIPVQRAHLNRSTYLRLLLPDLLPDDRVIYMDSDMVATGDLTALMAVDLAGAPIAAVPCSGPSAAELSSTGTVKGQYVNAGLLVMDLAAWRREGISAQAIALLAQGKLLSEDQSAINIVLRGRIKLLPAKYNIYALDAAYPTPEDLPSEIAVLHYVVNVKPWMWTVPFGEIWHFHAERIADLMPVDLRVTPKQKASRVEMHRRMIFGLVMLRRKHWRRLKVRRAIREGFVADYLAAEGRKVAG